MIFDVLKYQNTSLENQAELEALPEDLVRLYWNLAGGRHIDENPTMVKMCRCLADWAFQYGPLDQDTPRAFFMSALKEYNP